MYTVSELREVIGESFGHDMSGCQLYHLGCPVDEKRQGSEMCLRDYSMKPGSILVMTRMGQILNVTDAKVTKFLKMMIRMFSNNCYLG